MHSARQRGTATKAIEKFNTVAKHNEEQLSSNGMTKDFELMSVRRRSGASETIKKFNKVAEINQEKLNRNPFSETYTLQHFDKEAVDYGRPTHGSKTEARGIRAGVHVSREVLFLMETIETNAHGEFPNRTIKFGPLFYVYSNYSDKLVGMLLRARKYKLVDFEGEMLYQRQDDDKVIRMLMPIEEIRRVVSPSNDPANCIAIAK